MNGSLFLNLNLNKFFVMKNIFYQPKKIILKQFDLVFILI